MAEKLIINASNAAMSTQGEVTPAWTVAESTGAPTVTEQGALTDLNAVAIMQTGASAAEKAAVAFCILDSLISENSLNLSTEAARLQFKLKQGLDEYLSILDLLQVADIAPA